MSGSLFFVFYCMFPLCPYNRKELSNFVASWEAKLFAVSPKCNNNKKKFFIDASKKRKVKSCIQFFVFILITN